MQQMSLALPMPNGSIDSCANLSTKLSTVMQGWVGPWQSCSEALIIHMLLLVFSRLGGSFGRAITSSEEGAQAAPVDLRAALLQEGAPSKGWLMSPSFGPMFLQQCQGRVAA